VLPCGSGPVSVEEVTGLSSRGKPGRPHPRRALRVLPSPPVAAAGGKAPVRDSAAEVVRNWGRHGGLSSFVGVSLKPVLPGLSGLGEAMVLREGQAGDLLRISGLALGEAGGKTPNLEKQK